MLRSLFSSVALAGLVVAGSVPHVLRQTGVTCDFLMEGALLLASLPSAPVPIPTPAILAVDSSIGQLVEGDLQYVNFLICSSTFMDKHQYINSDGDIVYFG